MHKKPACCSICDEPVYEVLQRWDEVDRNAGEIKRTGRPNEDAVRVTFRLFNGSHGDFSFCGRCAKTLNPGSYTLLWNRNLAGYMREQNGNPEKFAKEFSNGILAEVKRTPLKELTDG